MIKNALLSIKKNVGRSLLLLFLMFIISNLIIAGLSIQSASLQSISQVRTSLGSEVTFSYQMQNLMKKREKGASMEDTLEDITVEMADSLKDLKYVENYNYTLSIGATSDQINPVEMTTNNGEINIRPENENMKEADFTIVGNTTMAYLSNFEEENYVLSSGRLLTNEDVNSQNCVIEATLASDNDLQVGDTISFKATNDETKTVTLTIIGIYTIEASDQMGDMMSNRQNPINQIYTDLSVAQSLNGDEQKISSATYYLDDPDHIDAFIELAKSSTDIDFETYSLNANDGIYQRSISSLENMQQFATIFLIVVVIAGGIILCLILVLTMRSRFYEYGVFLSLGQPKIKIILQQFMEIIMIALIAFILSLSTGKMVSNVISSMLESSNTNQNEMIMEIPTNSDDANSEKPTNNQNIFDRAFKAPENQELDVSITLDTTLQLAALETGICIISIILPSIYILRLTPREILGKKEG
ncbi:MAG: ABC transporter permease [Thomasclavelia sp.]